MAKRGAKLSKGATKPSPVIEGAIAMPLPSDRLHLTLTTLRKGAGLHRVHLEMYRADQFNPDAQGLCWVSRQDDSARAFVLFGDSIPDGALRQQQGPRSLLDDEQAYDAVLELAERIGVSIVPGIA